LKRKRASQKESNRAGRQQEGSPSLFFPPSQFNNTGRIHSPAAGGFFSFLVPPIHFHCSDPSLSLKASSFCRLFGHFKNPEYVLAAAAALGALIQALLFLSPAFCCGWVFSEERIFPVIVGSKF
jgi:hypothetical protein